LYVANTKHKQTSQTVNTAGISRQVMLTTSLWMWPLYWDISQSKPQLGQRTTHLVKFQLIITTSWNGWHVSL